MPIWLAMLLGVVQGFTEFLPVSSSGHLALLQNIFDMEKYTSNHIAFDVVLHMGTLLAVIIAFRKDILYLLKNFIGWILDGFKIKQKAGRRMIVMLIIATAPLAVGALISDTIEAMFSNTLFVGCALIFTALMLYFSDKVAKGGKTAKNAPYSSAVVVGLMQLVAVFPGVSRSGSTICAGLLTGFDKDFAVRFAFLLSIPAVVGASVFQLSDIMALGATGDSILTYAVGFFAAAISGYIAIFTVKLLMKKNSFKYFAFYCAVVGTATILFNIF